jgi:hypothetical protein
LDDRAVMGKYADYTESPADPAHTCANCAKYEPTDAGKGICFEYEVLPKAGCKFFAPKGT